MIESYDNYQLELFSEARGGIPGKPLPNRFFNFLRRHERKILIVIGIAISCIISFSWGVKKGKEASATKDGACFDLATKKAEEKIAITVPKQRQEKVKIIGQQKLIKPIQNSEADRKKTQPYTQGYTIQLASYKAKKFADTEADILKRKGLRPFILYKGDYVVLCVGKFSDKGQAGNSLSQLKKQYKDCYLRGL